MSLSSPHTQTDLGESYLKLQLDEHTLAVFPLEYAQEVLVIPRQRVTSIPNMSSDIVGLVNQRNRIYWLLDLSLLLGLNRSCQGFREYSIAFVKINQISVGLVVPKIQGVVCIFAQQIQSPRDNFSSEIIPYLAGCIIDEGKLTYVLDPLAIVETKFSPFA